MKKTARKSPTNSTSTVKPGAHTMQEVRRILTRDAAMGRHQGSASCSQTRAMNKAAKGK